MKYRVGRKQKRVILDKNGHEVAVCHKGKEEVAQQICDLLNEHGLVSKNESLHLVSHQRELLKAFQEHYEKTLRDDFIYDDDIESFLNDFNCG